MTTDQSYITPTSIYHCTFHNAVDKNIMIKSLRIAYTAKLLVDYAVPLRYLYWEFTVLKSIKFQLNVHVHGYL